MDPTNSVSKGVFVYKNGATRAKNRLKQSKSIKSEHSILDSEFINQPFYKEYLKAWKNIEINIEKLQKSSYNKIIKDLIVFISESYVQNIDKILPTAALLTGINQPDHYKKFQNITETIRERLNCSITIIESRACASLKNAIENMVYGLIEDKYRDVEDDHKNLKRSQCTMQVLLNWYQNQFPKQEHKLIIMLPDFEFFNAEVLQDFILIISSYCNRLPIILVLGVATAITAIHNSLPYHVTSKIRVKIFETQSAPVALNKILEDIVLSPECNFHLSGKICKFLTEIFLFYDFSINGFIQGLKYCMIEHFFQGNIYALCSDFKEYSIHSSNFTNQDYEQIRQLSSFRWYIEHCDNPKEIIEFLIDNDYLKDKLYTIIQECHIYFKIYRCFLEFIYYLVEDLPKSPMGKNRINLYTLCMTKDIVETAEFKECWQLLTLYSKNEFVEKFTNAVEKTEKYVNDKLDNTSIPAQVVQRHLNHVKLLIKKVSEADLTMVINEDLEDIVINQFSRLELREKLLEMSRQLTVSEYTKSVANTLKYIKSKIIYKYMGLITTRGPLLYEIFVFSDLSSIRKNIIGTPRAALHTALNDPHYYLQCSCCKLETTQFLLPTMPDLSVVYKLHLECGRMINLYDWLQAFRSVVDYCEDDNEKIVDPKIQARFTRAVAELQFLGYIKTSKRKTDHVTRLTW